MKLGKYIIAGLIVLMGMVGLTWGVQPVLAGSICDDVSGDLGNVAGCNETKKADAVANAIIKVVIGFVAVVAIIVIVIGGVQYTTSVGDASKAKKGRDAILYGVIGLVICLLAYVIVSFVSQAAV